MYVQCILLHFTMSEIIFHVSGVTVKQNKRQFFFAQDRTQYNRTKNIIPTGTRVVRVYV